ncbi:MAG: site-specific integrase, partial [Nanoarchaeota archaeon]|nr:site-specific integrase [Nanoarchaeota archaeon]
MKRKTNREYYETLKEDINSLDISGANKKHLQNFMKYCEAEGLCDNRLLKTLRHLKYIAVWITTDFHKAEKQDIIDLMATIREKGYKPNTIKDYISMLKKMYKVLFGDGEDYPKCVRWIKNSVPRHLEEKKSNVFTLEDMKKLTAVAENSIEACMINLNFEGCLRPSELLTLKIKDIKVIENGFELTVSGKTGSRPIFIYQSAQYLTEWLNHHPNKNNPEARVFLDIDLFKYRYLVKKLCRKARIENKPSYPYWFRHSGITYKRMLGVSDSALTNYAGWVGGSRRIQTYSHLTGRECKGEIEALYGLKAQEELKPESNKRCHICGETNGYAKDF